MIANLQILSINCNLTLHLLSYELALKEGYNADIVYGPTFLNGVPNVLYISRDNGNTWEELTITDGLAVESTFLRPRIENNIIRIDAKSTSFRAGAFTYHVPTILFYLE